MVRDTYDRLSVGNTELAYVERGAGEPVVFVHGGLSDLTYLEPMGGLRRPARIPWNDLAEPTSTQ